MKLSSLGLVVGFLNGLVGGIGGMVSVIVLSRFFRLEQKKAQATTLSYIWILSIVTIIVYLNKLKIQWNILIPLVTAGTLGGIVGTFALKKLSNKIVHKIFALVITATSLIIFFR